MNNLKKFQSHIHAEVVQYTASSLSYLCTVWLKNSGKFPKFVILTSCDLCLKNHDKIDEWFEMHHILNKLGWDQSFLIIVSKINSHNEQVSKKRSCFISYLNVLDQNSVTSQPGYFVPISSPLPTLLWPCPYLPMAVTEIRDLVAAGWIFIPPTCHRFQMSTCSYGEACELWYG